MKKVRVWDCLVVSGEFLKYYTPGQKYIELGDGSIPTDHHDHYGEWSSFSHDNGVIKDGFDEAIFCLMPDFEE